MTIDYERANRLLPKITLKDEVFNALCEPWRDALVVKLLGKNVGYVAMKDRLARFWKLQGGFEILNVDHGYFMVKFDLPMDKEKVMSSGPWMLFDHYLFVFNWTPEFVFPSNQIQKTMVWIRFPGLNILYYDKSVLLGMASAMGKPIRVDQNTLKVERGRFAQICVEIDLS